MDLVKKIQEIAKREGLSLEEMDLDGTREHIAEREEHEVMSFGINLNYDGEGNLKSMYLMMEHWRPEAYDEGHSEFEVYSKD